MIKNYTTCVFQLSQKPLCSCFSSPTPLSSSVQENAGDRLSAICISETHKANLHKYSAIMHVLKMLCMDLCLMLPSTGVDSVPFAYSNYLRNRHIPLSKNTFLLSCMHLCAVFDFLYNPLYNVYSYLKQCTHTGSHMPSKEEFLPICQLGDSEGHFSLSTTESSGCQ